MKVYYGDDNVIKKLRYSSFPLIIWGNGEISLLVRKKLKQNNLAYDLIVVDIDCMIDSEDVISLNTLNKMYSEYDVICGHLEAYKLEPDMLSTIFINCKHFYFFSELYQPLGIESITKKYLDDQKAKFIISINRLEDQESRLSAWAYLDSKIECNFKNLRVSEKGMYFFETSSWRFSNQEVLVDCGAYDGDTITHFMDFVGKDNYSDLIAIEPDKKNFSKLKSLALSLGLSRLKIFNLALADENKQIPWVESASQMSRIDNSSDNFINAVTLDSLLFQTSPTIIKLDIEGAELEALKGAECLIRTYRPKIFVAAYHKRDDLIELIDFLSDFGFYKLYFYSHKPIAIDSIIYAIPYK
jgi:FkbM family methyltransferase